MLNIARYLPALEAFGKEEDENSEGTPESKSAALVLQADAKRNGVEEEPEAEEATTGEEPVPAEEPVDGELVVEEGKEPVVSEEPESPNAVDTIPAKEAPSEGVQRDRSQGEAEPGQNAEEGGGEVEEFNPLDELFGNTEHEGEIGISNEIEQDEKEVAEAADIQATLEAYAVLLHQAGSKGVSHQAAAFMAVEMARIDRFLGTPSIGLEAFDATPRSATQQTTVSLESIGEKIKAAGKKALEVFLELWNKLITKGEQMIEKLKGGSAKLDLAMKKVEDQLHEAVQNVADNNKTGTEYELGGSPRYYIRGKFVAHDPAVLNPLVKFAAVDYPRAALLAYRGVLETLNSFKPGDDVDGFKTHVFEALGGITKLKDNAAVDQPWPDGMLLAQGAEHTFGMMVDQEDVEPEANTKVKLEDVPAMRVRYGKLETLKEVMEEGWEADQHMRDTWNEIAATLKRMGGNNAYSDEEYREIMNVIGGPVQHAMPQYPDIFKLIINVLLTWTMLVGYELDQHGRMMEDMTTFGVR